MDARGLHGVLAVGFSVFMVIALISGVVLSFAPVGEAISSPAIPKISLAEFLSNLEQTQSDFSKIVLQADGEIRGALRDDYSGQFIVLNASGEILQSQKESAFYQWVRELHRSLFIGDFGRVLGGMAALAMAIIALSGLWLLAHRMGGWRHVFGAMPDRSVKRNHSRMGRIAMPILMISSLSAILLTLNYFEILPDIGANNLAFPDSIEGAPFRDYSQSVVFAETPLHEIRALTFPDPNFAGDSYHLVTTKGEGFVNPVTGEWASYVEFGFAQKAYAWIHKLHTGEGLGIFALVLGGAAATGLYLLFTGLKLFIWRVRSFRCVQSQTRASDAEILIFVASESGSSWGFARAAHQALVEKGYKVRSLRMHQIEANYQNAKYILILAATYGDGDSPSQAEIFLRKLDQLPKVPFAVIGFGDQAFTHYCAFAKRVDKEMLAAGFPQLLPLQDINQSSPQAFARASQLFGKAIGTQIEVYHQPPLPKTHRFKLIGERRYGDKQAFQTRILRFKFVKPHPFAFPLHFAAGALLGVLTPPHHPQRYYSLASSSRSGFVEIAVSLHKNGVCSSYLNGLAMGEEIRAFVSDNPKFKLRDEARPVVLIGAGTGLAPLIGFVRDNKKNRPMTLFAGIRRRDQDFLFGEEVQAALHAGRLQSVHIAASREAGIYVQDKLAQEARLLNKWVDDGAIIAVCGGRDMVCAVKEQLKTLLGEAKIAELHQNQRYFEDSF